jgi:HK97 family phage portal protein
MRALLTRTLRHLTRWFRPKAAPHVSAAAGPGYLDLFHRRRPPSPRELLDEFKNTAWTCASINAGICASHPPRLYVATLRHDPDARCPRRPLDQDQRDRLHDRPHLRARLEKAVKIEEVEAHRVLDVLSQVNPYLNAFDLWELTDLYQEVHGTAYWLLQFDLLGVPEAIWPLPTHQVVAVAGRDPACPVACYEYRGSNPPQQFAPEEIIEFKFPDPRDPYGPGLSPLRACFENVLLTSAYLAFKQAKFQNHALPDAVISPDEILGSDERARYEREWTSKFQRGGGGKVLVADSPLRVEVLQHSLGDLALLAEHGKTKEDIANAFGVPLSLLVSETNLANMQAAEAAHMRKAIRPRLIRRDEKLNERLLPRYDPSRRLFFASDDPVPENQELALKQQESDLRHGVRSINQIRAARGEPPVSWGNLPWLPLSLAPTDAPRPAHPDVPPPVQEPV